MEVMRNPQLMRAFREGRKVSCNPAQQGAWNSSFVARSSSLCEINLMISFVSSHGHRACLGRRSAAGGWLKQEYGESRA